MQLCNKDTCKLFSRQTAFETNSIFVTQSNKIFLTRMIWSPRLTCPERSAGPPASMNEMNIPSPSSPPTMLKPSPEGPRRSTTTRGSLKEKE